MAIIHGGLSRIAFRYPDIDLENTKIIAWGAGQFFRDLYPLTGIKAEYTICPRPENHGKIIHGLEVKPPDFLKLENPDNILILIFSASSLEIGHQIGKIGRFRVTPAVEYGAENNHIIDELLLLKKNLHLPPSKKNFYSEVGFFTQGPIFPFTELALAYHRFNFPNDYHCFVTDAGQSPELIERCAQWVDEVIEVPLPETPGPQRRNYMIQTAKIGAEHIKNKGFKYSVRVRSGNITIGSVRKFIYKNFGTHDSYNPGKLGFFMGWSWRNVPFHISDAFMVARSDDMAALWDVDNDIRQDDDSSLAISSENHYSELARMTNECYLWSSFAKKIGYANSTIIDYLDFMRDKLIPLDTDLRTYPLKYIPIFSIDFSSGISPDEKWWNDLNNNFYYVKHKALEVSKFNFSVADHFANKIG